MKNVHSLFFIEALRLTDWELSCFTRLIIFLSALDFEFQDFLADFLTLNSSSSFNISMTVWHWAFLSSISYLLSSTSGFTGLSSTLPASEPRPDLTEALDPLLSVFSWPSYNISVISLSSGGRREDSPQCWVPPLFCPGWKKWLAWLLLNTNGRSPEMFFRQLPAGPAWASIAWLKVWPNIGWK